MSPRLSIVLATVLAVAALIVSAGDLTQGERPDGYEAKTQCHVGYAEAPE